MPSAAAVSRARASGLEITRVTGPSRAPSAAACFRPVSVNGASVRPSSRPAALTVDSPCRSRTSTGSGPGGLADEDAPALVARRRPVGREVADPVDLDGGQREVAAVAAVAESGGAAPIPPRRARRPS